MGFPVREQDHLLPMLLLMVALNLPAVCVAFVYSTTADTMVAWRKTLNLDPAKLHRACTTVITDAASVKRQCTSRSVCFMVCFFCGASPLSRNVSLSLCQSCECVA